MLSSTIFIAVLREGERRERGEKEREGERGETPYRERSELSMLFLSCFYQELTKHNQQLFL